MQNLDVYANTVMALVGLGLLLWFLVTDEELDKVIRRYFLHFITFSIIEAFAHDFEMYTATLDHLSIWRLILSFIGYSIRPAEILVLILLNMRGVSGNRKLKTILVSIPQFIAMICAASVFFTDVVYSYTPDNEFIRGPLGYSIHYIVFFYLFLLIALAVKNRIKYKESHFESILVMVLAIYITGSILSESFLGLRGTGRLATTISLMAYYIFFQTAWYKNSLAEEKNQRVEVERKSECDPLTGVLVRTAFQKKVEDIVERAPFDKSGALIFMDMDNFKGVNDSLGHAVGDQVLIDFSAELVRHFGHAPIGRFGGDEFYVYLENISLENLEDRVALLQTGLRKKYSSENEEITVTASLGVAYFSSNDGLSFKDLLNTADEAVYQAKDNGKGDFVVIKLQ